MEDGFDEIAKQLRITRATAIKNYCPNKVDELTREKEILSVALHLLAELIRRESPSLSHQLEITLKRLVLENSDISQSAEMVLTALHESH